MQTIYYSTPNFIRHTGNVVDLDAYRQKLALLREDSLAPRLDTDDAAWPEAEVAPRRDRRPRHTGRRASRAWLLDICASLSVVAMTLAFTLRVLAG